MFLFARTHAGWLALCLFGPLACSEHEELLARFPSDDEAADDAGTETEDAGAETRTLLIPITCGNPSHLVAASLTPNEDETEDLLLATGDCLVLVPNRGARSYGAPETIVAEGFGNTVALGQLDDTDGRGLLDAVGMGNELLLLSGDGSSFSSPTRFGETGESEPGTLLVADISGTPHPDVGMLTEPGDALVWEGNGLGQFERGPLFGIGRPLAALASAQAAADPALDLLVADVQLAVLPNQNDQFTYAVFAEEPVEIPAPRYVTAADFDADGDADVFTLDGNATSTSAETLGHWYKNDGENPGDGLVVHQGSIALPHAVFALLLDYDGDDAVDALIVHAAPENALTLLLGRRSPELSFTLIGSLPLEGNPRSVTVGDFDGDSRLDVAVALRDLRAIQVFFDPPWREVR